MTVLLMRSSRNKTGNAVNHVNITGGTATKAVLGKIREFEKSSGKI